MSTVTFVQPDGTKVEAVGSSGTSIMKTAISNDVKGIIADCGGSLACATCHVYVDAAALEMFPPASEEEDEMLDEVVSERLETSRLSCQLLLPDTGESITVTLPDEQW